VLYLASKVGLVVSRQEVAYAMEIPDHFLAKIAQQLARAGIIEIRQGRQGGYRLNVPPEKLSLLEVIEAISGEIFLNDCVLRPESCRKSSSCLVHRVWIKARDTLREMLSQVKINSLLDGENICFRVPRKADLPEVAQNHQKS
jgi:Rrf2 family protein